MSQHIPYESRHREVVYITDPPRKKMNGLGVAGFILSIFSLLTCGLLSPIALMVNLVALFRAPRRFAFAGMLISLLGTLWISMWFVGEMVEVNVARHRAQRAQETAVTKTSLEKTKELIEEFREDNGSRLPEPIEGNRIAILNKDAWGTELRYELEKKTYAIRSAGPDRQWDTKDDIVKLTSFFYRKAPHEVRDTLPAERQIEADQPAEADTISSP